MPGYGDDAGAHDTRVTSCQTAMSKFKPKTRQFEPADTAWNESSGWSWPTETENSKSKWHSRDGDDGGWGAKQWGSDWVTPDTWGNRDDYSGKDRGPDSRATAAADVKWSADAEPKRSKTVTDYEAEARKRMAATTDKAAKSRVLKRPASAADKATAKAKAKAAAKVATVGTVNIKEISTKAIVESCTKDGYLRKGYDIGIKIAKGKGIDPKSEDGKAYGKVGYAAAKAFLVKLGKVAA